MKRNSGFTLIELLIVVAILGILGAILFVAIGGNPQRDARDARRIADVNQLQLALELFKNADANNAYPATIAALSPTYIGGEPKDPKTGLGYSYAQNAGANYHLGAGLENPANKALCTDADFNSAGWTGAFNGGIGDPNTNCGGASSGDSNTVPIYDVRS